MELRRESPRDNVIRLPDLYIGHKQWDTAALHALVGYVFERSIDPKALNDCTALAVKLAPSGTIIIKDNGRGLPVPTADRSGTERSFIDVLTWYGATGTTGQSQGYLEQCGFLDYIGLVLSCLSEALTVTTVWDGIAHRVSCAQGQITAQLRAVGETSDRGTEIELLPDAAVFAGAAFSRDTLISILLPLSKRFPHVRISFDDDSGSTTVFPTQ